MRYKSILAALLLMMALPALAGSNWQPTDKYSIRFSSSDASGIFKTFNGTLVFDEQNPAASRFTAVIDVASINTGNGLQNKHAKGAEWFDAATYPQIRFTSEKIAKAGNGYQATGTLEMHGVKKQVTIPFTFQRKGNTGTFSGSFSVNRNDYHIGKAGNKVSEAIKVDISVPVVQK
ncbi:YceI family protein [Taibaiella koreensis]|uniref:YceI family protein n=1 Tax=Taibaiella koreensis TaxID=1268548 RepID=UPI000E59EB36|nr:YceI family protein [Taibaiella koreensis]